MKMNISWENSPRCGLIEYDDRTAACQELAQILQADRRQLADGTILVTGEPIPRLNEIAGFAGNLCVECPIRQLK